MKMSEERGPLEIEVDDLPEQDEIKAVSENPLTSTTPQATRIVDRRKSRLGRWLIGLGISIGSLTLGVWAYDFAISMLERSPVLGGIAVTLLTFFILVAAFMSLRELSALARLGKIESLRFAVENARSSQDLKASRACIDQVAKLHRGKADVAWGAARMSSGLEDLVDATALLDTAERELMAPLDARALAEVEIAAARVATITALVPVALADVTAALYSNIVMIRRIAEIYGGRAGTLGAWRLTKAVLAHLAATGAVSAGEDLVGSALGGGLLGKLSRRFGEGLINGALTARVGITAMELCRPMPFHATRRPGVAATVRRALTGLFRKEVKD